MFHKESKVARNNNKKRHECWIIDFSQTFYLKSPQVSKVLSNPHLFACLSTGCLCKTKCILNTRCLLAAPKTTACTLGR